MRERNARFHNDKGYGRRLLSDTSSWDDDDEDLPRASERRRRSYRSPMAARRSSWILSRRRRSYTFRRRSYTSRRRRTTLVPASKDTSSKVASASTNSCRDTGNVHLCGSVSRNKKLCSQDIFLKQCLKTCGQCDNELETFQGNPTCTAGTSSKMATKTLQLDTWTHLGGWGSETTTSWQLQVMVTNTSDILLDVRVKRHGEPVKSSPNFNRLNFPKKIGQIGDCFSKCRDIPYALLPKFKQSHTHHPNCGGDCLRMHHSCLYAKSLGCSTPSGKLGYQDKKTSAWKTCQLTDGGRGDGNMHRWKAV